MTAIGDSLRRERQKRHLELAQIARELKISQRFLEAIEQDDFAKLPGGVFTKSFVRQYASLLGLDAEDMVAQVTREIEPPVEIPAAEPNRPEVPGIEVEMMEDGWQSVRERRMPLPSWVRAGALLVVLMVVCSGVYYWVEERSHRSTVAHVLPPPQPSPVAATPAPAPPVETAPPVAQATPEPAASAPEPAKSDASTPAPTATPAKPASDVPVLPPNPNASVRVAITADEPVWVRAEVNGKYQFSGTLQPQESRTIDADGEVVLRLGNAGGATITLNGKPVGAVGPKGQIRTVQFNANGFQVVPTTPKVLDPSDHL